MTIPTPPPTLTEFRVELRLAGLLLGGRPVPSLPGTDPESGSCGFDRSAADGRLILTARHIKALLKEAAEVYGGKQWQRYVKDNVRVEESEVVLLHPESDEPYYEPDGIESIKARLLASSSHIINYESTHEYVDRARIRVTLRVTGQPAPDSQWASFWRSLYAVGIGARRYGGFGRFESVDWQKL